MVPSFINKIIKKLTEFCIPGANYYLSNIQAVSSFDLMMMETTSFLSAIILLIISKKCIAFADKPLDDLVVHFKEFKECPGMQNNTIRYNRLELNYVGNDTFMMEGELEALDKVDGNLMFIMQIDYCGASDNNDACTHKFDHKIYNICQDMKMPASMVRGVFTDSGIPPKCPIEPGKYFLTPKPVQMDSFTKSLVAPGYWKLESKIVRKNDQKVEQCFYCKGEVRSKNTRRKGKGKKEKNTEKTTEKATEDAEQQL